VRHPSETARHRVSQDLKELGLLGETGETYGTPLKGGVLQSEERESESETFGNGDTSSPLTGDVSPDQGYQEFAEGFFGNWLARQPPLTPAQELLAADMLLQLGFSPDTDPEWIHDPEARREQADAMHRDNQAQIAAMLADHEIWKTSANASSVVDLT
jgi:hypothetical protein